MSKSAKQPRYGTQAATILSHLKSNPYITDVTASGLYGIGQCAGCVFKLRKLGWAIHTKMKSGVRAPYAEYSIGGA